MTTPTIEETVEYGVKFPHWPNNIRSTVWLSEGADARLVHSTRPSPTSSTPVEDLRAAIASHNAYAASCGCYYRDAVLVSRTRRVETVTTETLTDPVEVPRPVVLPTTRGSVVRARLARSEVRTFIHEGAGSRLPWLGGNGGYYASSELINPVVIFDTGSEAA